MQVSGEVAQIIDTVFLLAEQAHFEYVTPELMLYAACQNQVFAQAFENCGGKIQKLDKSLRTYLEEYAGPCAQDTAYVPQLSHGAEAVLTFAFRSAQNSGRTKVELSHMVHAIYELEESYAVYYMRKQGVEQAQLLQEMILISEEHADTAGRKTLLLEQEEEDDSEDEDSCADADANPDTKVQAGFWQRYAVCVNDALEGCNPLIGRQEELERTMQILCRKEKNNPLHLGEPGVGKTALIYGLAKLLNEDQVPEPLLGAKIYALDLGSLLAGTQYRGEFEKRLKKVLDSIAREEKPIIYLDEIHNIVGAGAVNGGSLDISNMLKPYLSAGHIRFIGATTFEEYKKHFEKSKSLVRRFQNVEIKEPEHKDAVHILEGLKETYEAFHGVVYEDGVLEYAVTMSVKYMKERFLPDKAIDLMDEAGAYVQMHPAKQNTNQKTKQAQTVSRQLIDEIVAKICHIPKQTVESDETEALATLEGRLKELVYGQDEAVTQVVNAVKFSRAGLLEEDKPLASLLFVGPTGVGKTEIAKSLAKELGIRLLRFDMSEYEEKHAVAKLIGAPAGYVGYEEGGLLTEEIRRHPHAVLLLDEIEKAHPDIYHILLQVMDYATLTDNQGRKADFRNVIIIMTSNAGASRIGKPGIGFQGEDTSADIIFEEVKRIFQPEFRNRLNKIVAFHSMNENMAEQIVEKKLGELEKMLLRRQIQLTSDDAAKTLIKKKGISAEYGAREIERVISSEVKPLFVDEILFGKLKQGGACALTAVNGQFQIAIADA